MKQILPFTLVSIFAIFIGCQIAEGALLVPHWQSLSSTDFYTYYSEFGPSIGLFFTVLTIMAALIPIGVSIYCKVKDPAGFRYALISAFLAILFVSSFYIYFKDTNELFYQSALSEVKLKNELVTWSYWHWGRIVIECLSLVFLILCLIRIQNIKRN